MKSCLLVLQVLGQFFDALGQNSHLGTRTAVSFLCTCALLIAAAFFSLVIMYTHFNRWASPVQPLTDPKCIQL